MSTTFLDELVSALKKAATYNGNDMVAPAAVLWPDRSREWEAVVPELRRHLPVLTLGDYDPENLTGPAIWIRCMIGRTLPQADWPEEVTPVIYLPGYSRTDLRAVEDCPEPIRTLAELQYRGVIWSQKNGRDWTLVAFLQSADGGLSIPVAGDTATAEALCRAAAALLAEPTERLRANVPLRAHFLNELLAPDLAKQVLRWMDEPERERAGLGLEAWQAFREQCRGELGFDPEKDGVLVAAEFLGNQEGSWVKVWERFCEAPHNYPQIPGLLRRAGPEQIALVFERTPLESWPQDNEIQEQALRSDLLELAKQQPDEARKALSNLELRHGCRRAWVWAKLGEAPLAMALGQLVRLADATSVPLRGASIGDIAEKYCIDAWQADSALLGALAAVTNARDGDAVAAAARVCYEPWLRETCEHFQEVWRIESPDTQVRPADRAPGLVLLYADGLRMDLAHALRDCLVHAGYECCLRHRLAPLPTVTSTGKPAALPVMDRLRPGPKLSPRLGEEAELSSLGLRKLLEENGFAFLSADDTGDPSGCAWTECGRLDEIGHIEGRHIAARAQDEVRVILQRADDLLKAGWRELRIVTDHGWLLLPGGLPTRNLPEAATEIRKGRCARLKPGARVDCQTVAWHWDPDVHIAVAPGTACFVSGHEFEHGGISPQEVVIPEITVRPGAAQVQLAFVSARWVGMRCRVRLSGSFAGVMVDLRIRDVDEVSSVAAEPRPVDEDGQAALLCPDQSLEGTAAVVVAYRRDAPSRPLARRPTVIGASEDA